VTSTESNSDSCICVLGWYFYDRDFYEKLSSLANTDIYVVSHKSPKDVPDWASDVVGVSNFFYEPNYGYDWGGYQQFLERDVWRQYKYVFFMHDDIIVKDYGFVEECRRRLETYVVVGNGAQQEHPIIPANNPQRYSHTQNLPKPDEAHSGVRGSFLATTRAGLETVGAFEVFWDRFHISDAFGNHSLVSTFHKWSQKADSADFCDWLSETYCESQWITELQRGKPDNLPQVSTLLKYTPKYYFKKVMRKMLLTVCKWKTEQIWTRGRAGPRYQVLDCFERFFSRRPPVV